jgi:hypothetical protein
VLIDGLPLDAPAAPLSDLLRVGLDAAPQEPALVSATRSVGQGRHPHPLLPALDDRQRRRRF